MTSWQERGRIILTEARRVAKILRLTENDADLRVDYCRQLLKISATNEDIIALSEKLTGLSIEEIHYWVGTFYTLMLSAQRRREQAAYFTPPYLATAVLDLSIEHGFDLISHTVLDPAAGGAAFLSTIAARMLAVGINVEEIRHRLDGVEIDPGLARISQMLLADRLQLSQETVFRIAAGDATQRDWRGSYNLVVANPPYGRVSSADLSDERWREVAHSGHINRYALFTELCFRAAKPGGLVALVIPSGFRTGPLYKKMRTFVRGHGDVLAVGSVGTRDDVFVDVAQDVSVLIVRKGSSSKPAPTRFQIITPGPVLQTIAEWSLPVDPDEPWPTPAPEDVPRGGATLSDYGVRVRSGYFVWNRQQDRLRTTGGATSYPLIWARNIKAGKTCLPAGKTGKKADFVWFQDDSAAIIREPAIVLQRTTNNKQPRRLIAAHVDSSVLSRWTGFVSENHTIVLTSDRKGSLRTVCDLLNSEAVDQRYRRLSGTAAVSVQLLRLLDLPSPYAFASALQQFSNPETAAAVAYAESIETVAARDVA